MSRGVRKGPAPAGWRARARACLALASLLACAATVALWVRGQRRSDYVVFFTPSARIQGAASDARGLFVVFTGVAFGPDQGLTIRTGSVPAEQFQRVRDLVYDSAAAKLDGYGFGAAGSRPGEFVEGARHYALRVPHWFAAGLTAVAPGGWVIGRVKSAWRKRRGRCRACGYDLRASPDKCPECGWEG